MFPSPYFSILPQKKHKHSMSYIPGVSHQLSGSQLPSEVRGFSNQTRVDSSKHVSPPTIISPNFSIRQKTELPIDPLSNYKFDEKSKITSFQKLFTEQETSETLNEIKKFNFRKSIQRLESYKAIELQPKSEELNLYSKQQEKKITQLEKQIQSANQQIYELQQTILQMTKKQEGNPWKIKYMRLQSSHEELQKKYIALKVQMETQQDTNLDDNYHQHRKMTTHSIESEFMSALNQEDLKKIYLLTNGK